MSEIRDASGGDGWSTWSINREPDGNYFIVVTSHAERNTDGSNKVVYVSDDIRNGRAALEKAISVASNYAQRMAS